MLSELGLEQALLWKYVYKDQESSALLYPSQFDLLQEDQLYGAKVLCLVSFVLVRRGQHDHICNLSAVIAQTESYSLKIPHSFTPSNALKTPPPPYAHPSPPPAQP